MMILCITYIPKGIGRDYVNRYANQSRVVFCPGFTFPEKLGRDRSLGSNTKVLTESFVVIVDREPFMVSLI